MSAVTVTRPDRRHERNPQTRDDRRQRDRQLDGMGYTSLRGLVWPMPSAASRISAGTESNPTTTLRRMSSSV